jgi:hypothetical protein
MQTFFRTVGQFYLRQTENELESMYIHENKTRKHMKATLLIIVFSLGIMTTAVGAGEPGMAVRKHKDPGMYTLIYKTDKKSDLMMLVSDHAGTLLFWDLIMNSDGFMRSLNFKFITPGEYSIDVIDLNQRNDTANPGSNRKSKKLNHVMPIPKLDSLML